MDLSAPVTTGNIVGLIFHIFSTSSFRSFFFLAFLSFSYSLLLMFLSLWIATSVTTAFFCSLSTTTMVVSHHQFISLDQEVPQDLSSFILHYLWRYFLLPLWDFQPILGTDVPVHYSTYTWLWRSMYAVRACVVHPTIMRWSVSEASLHILHLKSCLVL